MCIRALHHPAFRSPTGYQVGSEYKPSCPLLVPPLLQHLPGSRPVLTGASRLSSSTQLFPPQDLWPCGPLSPRSPAAPGRDSSSTLLSFGSWEAARLAQPTVNADGQARSCDRQPLPALRAQWAEEDFRGSLSVQRSGTWHHHHCLKVLAARTQPGHNTRKTACTYPTGAASNPVALNAGHALQSPAELSQVLRPRATQEEPLADRSRGESGPLSSMLLGQQYRSAATWDLQAGKAAPLPGDSQPPWSRSPP